ncbi:DUF3149 domain-containing protein [Zobellella maritima]|nr:DUF3149 domain-containing protein [Zobellella maritima]
MEFWLKLMFGSDIGLMSMIVVIATFLLISFYAGYFIYKIKTDQPNE